MPVTGASRRSVPRGERRRVSRAQLAGGACALPPARGAWGREGHKAAGVAPRRRLERVRGPADPSDPMAVCWLRWQPVLCPASLSDLGVVWTGSADLLERRGRETREKAVSLLRPARSLRLRSSGKEAGRMSRAAAGRKRAAGHVWRAPGRCGRSARPGNSHWSWAGSRTADAGKLFRGPQNKEGP